MTKRPTTAADLPGGALFVDMCRCAGQPVTGLRLLSWCAEHGQGHGRATDILRALVDRGDIVCTGLTPGFSGAQRNDLVGQAYEMAPLSPTTWAAVVLDKEHGVHSGATRWDAIDAAMEGALDAVYTGWEELGRVDVEVYEDPEWCEKAPQFCNEHEHEQHARWLVNQCGETTEVEIYEVNGDPDYLDWREVPTPPTSAATSPDSPPST